MTEQPSQCVQFGDNENSEILVKGCAHTQSLFVGAPVEAGDGLCRQRDVLEQGDRAHDPHILVLIVLLHTLRWVVAEKQHATRCTLNFLVH